MILKISLRPLNKFFFGGESSFNEVNENNNRRATYVLHSRYYPQQTGVLGLIRNQLLLQNGLLWDNSASIKDKAAAKSLIGNYGFQVGYDKPYGVIKRISAVFLEDQNGNICPPAPRDDVWMEKKSAKVKMLYTRKNDISILRNYSEKSGLYDQLFRQDGEPVNLENVFEKKEQVGITKAAHPWKFQQNDDDAGYYYQTFLSFKKDATFGELLIRQFVCYAEFADTPAFKFESGLVEFGGERCTFFMDVEKVAEKDFPKVQTGYKLTTVDPTYSVKRLVCLSPCAVDIGKLRPLAGLIVSQSLQFRFLQSKVDSTEEYQNINRHTSVATTAPAESKLFQLFDRGSVVYFDPGKEADVRQLFDSADFQNIGYNQYNII